MQKEKVKFHFFQGERNFIYFQGLTMGKWCLTNLVAFNGRVTVLFLVTEKCLVSSNQICAKCLTQCHTTPLCLNWKDMDFMDGPFNR